MNARDAFAAYKGGIPEVMASIEKSIASGAVRPVHTSVFGNAKGKWKDFLKKFQAKLVSEKAPVGRVGGGGHFEEVAKIVGRDKLQAWRQQAKAFNEVLKSKGDNYRVFHYFKVVEGGEEPAED